MNDVNFSIDDDDSGDHHDSKFISELINPVLYTKGVKSEFFYLILQGNVMICSGNEGFMMEQGAFNHMGSENLHNESYTPDFSARVIGKAKLL